VHGPGTTSRGRFLSVTARFSQVTSGRFRSFFALTAHFVFSDTQSPPCQEKLNAYLRFIESGDLLEQYPDAKSLKPQITVALKHIPSEKGIQFLTRVSEAIEKLGIAFRYDVLPY